MNDTGPAAPRSRVRLPLGAMLAGLMLAGIISSGAVPAAAAPSSARSVTTKSTAAAPAAASPAAAFFGIGPASATKIDNRPYFAWAITPRGVLKDYAAIVNFGAQPVTLQVFTTNAESLAHGATGFQSQGQSKGGPASWITLGLPGGSSTVRLAPRSNVIVPIMVQVPANAPPGDHEGAIVASLTSTIESKNHAKVHLVQQVAARVLLRVSGPLHPGLSVTGVSVDFKDPVNPLASGVATLRFTVRNSGNVLLGGRQRVTVHGLFGSSESAQGVVTIPAMLPGGTDSESVTVRGVYPELLMHGDITIAPLAVAGQVDPGLTNYSTSAGFWAIPWIPLAILILIAAGVVAIIFRRRFRRRPPTASKGPEPVKTTTEVEA
jgi:hypothetical protein